MFIRELGTGLGGDYRKAKQNKKCWSQRKSLIT